MRKANVTRSTKETSVTATVFLDGTGSHSIETGIGFFDHMLEQLSRHSLIDVELTAKGDLHIDAHHTVEDVGIVLGEAFSQALADRRGIGRYGCSYVPMDDALARVAVDVSGRPFLVWKVGFSSPKIGDFDTELIREFFQALIQRSGITVHVEVLEGHNAHHVAESLFKALARALREAIQIDNRQSEVIPSTKGSLKG